MALPRVPGLTPRRGYCRSPALSRNPRRTSLAFGKVSATNRETGESVRSNKGLSDMDASRRRLSQPPTLDRRGLSIRSESKDVPVVECPPTSRARSGPTAAISREPSSSPPDVPACPVRACSGSGADHLSGVYLGPPARRQLAAFPVDDPTTHTGGIERRDVKLRRERRSVGGTDEANEGRRTRSPRSRGGRLMLRWQVRSCKPVNYARKTVCRASKAPDLVVSTCRNGRFGVVGQLFIAQWPPRSDGDFDRHAPGRGWSFRQGSANPERRSHPPEGERVEGPHCRRCERSILSTCNCRYLHRLRAESAIRKRRLGLQSLGTGHRDQRTHEQRRGQLRLKPPWVQSVGAGNSIRG